MLTFFRIMLTGITPAILFLYNMGKVKNFRQYRACSTGSHLRAQESLSLVENSIESGMPEDFYSIDLTDAYESLGRILGESLGEDLVNEIFSKFCMGK